MTPITMPLASNDSEAKKDIIHDQLLGCGQDIPTLGATTFDDLLSSDEGVTVFALRIAECTGLLGTTLEDITQDSLGNRDHGAGCGEQGAV